MNILEAKTEIRNTVQMYLSKNDYGDYAVSTQRQRPIFLLGPPGIGKTEIVAQVAEEMQLGFVNYTITHHTRQSAIGLPTIVERQYKNTTFSITQYTLSEIISSVYEAIEYQQIEEGILFIDEINCVSESLAPAMLDLLQNKKFGPHRIPEGWILVTAGNPPEYNRSARNFDMVTLDRLKKIDVQTDFKVWKKYAYKNLFSDVVLSYLNHQENYLFHAERTPSGLLFATPRGWEDLSQAITIYSQIKLKITLELISQFIQFDDVARDFYRYYLLYERYRNNYDVDEILRGDFKKSSIQIKKAKFDERYAVLEVITNELNQITSKGYVATQIIKKITQTMKLTDSNNYRDIFIQEIEFNKNKKDQLKTDKTFESISFGIINRLNEFLECSDYKEISQRVESLKSSIDDELNSITKNIENALEFINQAYGEGQELVALMVNLLSSIHIMRFVSIKRVESFYKYNSKLILDGNNKELLNDIEKYESSMHD